VLRDRCLILKVALQKTHRTISSSANFLSKRMVGLLASRPLLVSMKQVVVRLTLGQSAWYLLAGPPIRPGKADRFAPLDSVADDDDEDMI
jgi:hypothetical protein